VRKLSACKRPFQISSSLIICPLGFIEHRAHAEKFVSNPNEIPEVQTNRGVDQRLRIGGS
jgi:hypothetical protein